MQASIKTFFPIKVEEGVAVVVAASFFLTEGDSLAGLFALLVVDFVAFAILVALVALEAAVVVDDFAIIVVRFFSLLLIDSCWCSLLFGGGGEAAGTGVGRTDTKDFSDDGIFVRRLRSACERGVVSHRPLGKVHVNNHQFFIRRLLFLFLF